MKILEYKYVNTTARFQYPDDKQAEVTALTAEYAKLEDPHESLPKYLADRIPEFDECPYCEVCERYEQECGPLEEKEEYWPLVGKVVKSHLCQACRDFGIEQEYIKKN